MRIPPSLAHFFGDAHVGAPHHAYSTFDDEEELALGWECANPSLQIESWKEEAAAEAPRAAY